MLALIWVAMQKHILNIFLFFAVAVNIKLNHKIESFRKHHFDLGNMVVDSKKSKCLSQLIGTSVESYSWFFFFLRYLQIVSEDLDYWFPRWIQPDCLLVSRAPDTLRKQGVSWVYKSLWLIAIRTADLLMFARYLLYCMHLRCSIVLLFYKNCWSYAFQEIFWNLKLAQISDKICSETTRT